jgi:hypothetical protein
MWNPVHVTWFHCYSTLSRAAVARILGKQFLTFPGVAQGSILGLPLINTRKSQ